MLTDGFSNQRREPGTLMLLHMVKDLLAHIVCPEFLQVIDDLLFRLGRIRIGTEELTDLVSHGNEAFDAHAYSLCKILSGWL